MAREREREEERMSGTKMVWSERERIESFARMLNNFNELSTLSRLDCECAKVRELNDNNDLVCWQ